VRHISAIEKCFPLKESPSVTWIDVNGIHDTALVKRIGECFRLHPLFLEDIVTTGQYPKFEDFGDYVFVVLKMLEYEQGGQIAAEQVSIVLGPNFVISFQEKVADLFKPIRDMIQNNHLFRNRGSDYLAYSLIDLIIDRYFPILEKLGDDIEDKENQLIANPVSGTLGSIQQLKKELLFLRKSIWPLREVISSLSRGITPLIKDETRIYLRDIHDHTVQVIDTMETLREIIYGMFDIYLSSMSNRMNEIMKVLTVFATIFIPLTFLVGVYGMNFKFMPELEWKWSHPILWLFMIGVAGSMLWYFRTKKWF
jgi:magnesium transporter